MRIPFFHVDAFTTALFRGNPAAVMVLPRFPDDATLQAIAAENNLAETAFLVPGEAVYGLRWFTPNVEVPLCGHATLASAAVIMERLEVSRDTVTFETASGALTVRRDGGRYSLDFPTRTFEPVPMPSAMPAALNATPLEVCANPHTYLALLENAEAVRALQPDFSAIAALDRPGLIVTARGDDGYDFVSRFFAPAKGNPEDAVTGTAHCMLAPYWASKLGIRTFRAHQASPRGGDILCRLVGERVELEGDCVFYVEGFAELAL